MRLAQRIVKFSLHFREIEDKSLAAMAQFPVTAFASVEACAQTGLPGTGMHLPVIWTSYQFPVPLPSRKLLLSQSKVRT